MSRRRAKKKCAISVALVMALTLIAAPAAHAAFDFGPKADFGAGAGPVLVAVGDLDGDGNSDLATANISSDDVSVLLGNGDGTFAPKTDFGTGVFPTSVAIGD